MKAEPAAQELLDHNGMTKLPTSCEAAAIARLTNAMHYAFDMSGGPDLAIKAFYDLNSVFFRGPLRRKIVLRRTDDDGFKKSGFTNVVLLTQNLAKCAIPSNATVILLKPGWQPFKQMFCTLLHEMVVSNVLADRRFG